ncbi:thioesterase II family protein [Parachitinimonas caeni]|uniref:Alpha/beta fold hydrolase n=1 Tax=Parachitinimonas caeni TaxID=3031301 RepID=A0ABT7DZA4_9NEIS|nr:alpha/beta fold hydrolase [Parachitinimonas caeni]MDK2124403.1 alpha/beta fold hydrolase [Parachitinimonas caeni]
MGSSRAALRVFCLPFAGGGASNFLPFRRVLTGHAVVPVQYPGHETRMDERCLRDFSLLVDGILGAMQPYLDQPYALLGYSMGARVALGIENRARELGMPGPQGLLLAANRAPDGTSPYHGIANLPQAQFIAHVERYGGLPAGVLEEPSLAEMAIRVLRRDFAVLESMPALQPATCPIFAYAGRSDPSASPALMAGWQHYTQAAFALREFDGEHFFLRTEPEFGRAVCADLTTWSIPATSLNPI